MTPSDIMVQRPSPTMLSPKAAARIAKVQGGAGAASRSQGVLEVAVQHRKERL